MKNLHFLVVTAFLTLPWVLVGSMEIPARDAKSAHQLLAAGRLLYDDGKYKQAADTLAAAMHLFETAGDSLQLVRSGNLHAECLSNLGQCEDASRVLQRSLTIITSIQGDHRADVAETYYYLSRQAGGCARRFDEAISLMRKSLDIKREIYPAGDASYAFDFTFLGYIYNSKGKYDSALIYLDQAIDIRGKKLADDDIELSHTMFNLAASYEGKSDLGRALSLNQRALRIRVKKLGDVNATVSNSINSIGRVYRKLGNNERALEYYRKALEIRKNTLGPTHPNVAASYYEIGNLYGNNSNYHSSVEYIQEGNRILENNAQVSRDVLPTYYAYAGKMYGLIGRHDEAKASIQKGVTVANVLSPDHPYRAVVYNIAGEYFGETGDLKRQGEFFDKAIRIYRKSYGEGSEREADVIAKIVAAQATYGDVRIALTRYKEALNFYTSKLGTSNPKVTSVLLGIGDVHMKLKDFTSAERWYRQALESASVMLNKTEEPFPPAQNVENKPLAMKIARSMARLYQLRAPAGAKGLSEQRMSLASYQFAIRLADEITQDYAGEAARIQLEKEKRQLYAGALDIAWMLHQSGYEPAMATAFELSEKSKATQLLENARDVQAKTQAGVPDSLVDRERDIRIELAYYKNALYQASKRNDTAAVKSFEQRVFDSGRTLERFKGELEAGFPAYYRIKYANESTDLPGTVTQLDENTAMLHYFVSDSALYCFRILKGSIRFSRQVIDDEFMRIVNGYRRSLTDTRFIVDEPRRADSLYLSTARSLYSLLTLPEPDEMATQRLIVVPDDFISQLNFATLLYEDPMEVNYRTLPYAGNRFIIGYAYSAAFLAHHKAARKVDDHVAGFAPSYTSNFSTVDSGAQRTGNMALPGATQEVNRIRDLMGGKAWIDEDATETNFKKYGGGYGILHLAMHSFLDDDEPHYSELLFNRDRDNDGDLTISEIYNLKLNAQMVVLSACSSGSGKIQQGEGPISLSRAFSFAGCPSVVMTLWKVPDQVTTRIMENFYEGLVKGLPKDEALRAAQMKFVEENTDPLYKHPYYWAGFVVMGDTAPLQTSSNLVYYIVAALLIGVTAFVLVRRKRTRSL